MAVIVLIIVSFMVYIFMGFIINNYRMPIFVIVITSCLMCMRILQIN